MWVKREQVENEREREEKWTNATNRGFFVRYFICFSDDVLLVFSVPLYDLGRRS